LHGCGDFIQLVGDDHRGYLREKIQRYFPEVYIYNMTIVLSPLYYSINAQWLKKTVYNIVLNHMANHIRTILNPF